MKDQLVQKAAVQFGQGEPHISILGEGLIHRTYKVSFSSGASIVLQCINQATFKQPENIIGNYCTLLDYLGNATAIRIPSLHLTHQGKLFWTDKDGNFWRATEYIDHSYSPGHPGSAREAFLTGRCFGKFTAALDGLDITRLEIIIPGFHNLSFRYHQFEQSLSNATKDRLTVAGRLIEELQRRHKLVAFYDAMIDHPDFRARAMHHDCKMSNILFDTRSGDPICPVDLDTVMPGLFFSDLGDMIRSMAGTVDENSIAFDSIAVREEYYRAIVDGYLEAMGGLLTPTELQHIHHAGLLLIYMQSLRFLADYCNNDIYYRTAYAGQNYDRALNQFILLEKLENFLADNLNYVA